MNFLNALLPEAILTGAACLLFVLAAFRSAAVRHGAPWLAMASLIAAIVVVANRAMDGFTPQGVEGTIALGEFANYVRLLTLAVGGLLVLINWPTDSDASGNSSMRVERESPEYFGLMLLSFVGVMLVATANDLILLFLGVELAAIPTYVMVSISRPIAVAQEAAVKYFFLGAFSAALTLFGLSFLFGATGSITLSGIAAQVGPSPLSMPAWLTLGTILVVIGMAFKMAAFPLHFYAPDVYTGAATPLTALLSFVPKAAGVVGLIRVLLAVSGEFAPLPATLQTTLWVIAVASMTIGNVLGLMQQNIKRLMACSSIAQSGYMLTGVLVLFGSPTYIIRANGLEGTLFYLAAYGLMNIGVFAVLMMLPAKADPFVYDGKIPPATSAETFGEIAGMGRKNVGLGLMMAVCCFSLIGLPLTAGFFGKFYLIRPALSGGYYWLTIILVINAAISAGYYLRIVAAMFLKEPRGEALPDEPAACGVHVCRRTIALMLVGVISAGGSLMIGTCLPATEALRMLTLRAADVLPTSLIHQTPVQPATPSVTSLAQ